MLSSSLRTTSPGSGKRRVARLENSTWSPAVTSKTPPLEGTSTTASSRFAYVETSSSANLAALGAYPHEVQNSIRMLGFWDTGIPPPSRTWISLRAPFYPISSAAVEHLPPDRPALPIGRAKSPAARLTRLPGRSIWPLGTRSAKRDPPARLALQPATGLSERLVFRAVRLARRFPEASEMITKRCIVLPEAARACVARLAARCGHLARPRRSDVTCGNLPPSSS